MARSRTLSFFISWLCARNSKSARSKPTRSSPVNIAIVAGTAPPSRTIPSSRLAVSKFCGRGKPCAMTVDSSATAGWFLSRAERTSSLMIINQSGASDFRSDALTVFRSQREFENCACRRTFSPLHISPNHAGARANICHSPTRILANVAAVEPAAVILDQQFTCIRVRDVGAHLHVFCTGVTADVAQSFLSDAINLNLRIGRQAEFFIQRIIAYKLTVELAIGRRVFDCMRQRKLQSRRKSDILQRRRTQVLTDPADFLRDCLDFRAQRARL